jgi:hypothetical protein
MKLSRTFEWRDNASSLGRELGEIDSLMIPVALFDLRGALPPAVLECYEVRTDD